MIAARRSSRWRSPCRSCCSSRPPSCGTNRAMARIRLFAVFAIAIVAGGTFAYATYRYIQDRPAAGAPVQTRPVVIAAANLDVGAELRREDVRVIDWPAEAVPAG